MFSQSHVGFFFLTKCFSFLIEFSLQFAFGTKDDDNFIGKMNQLQSTGNEYGSKPQVGFVGILGPSLFPSCSQEV